MVATNSTSAPLITVFGATGNMGGSTVNHLIKSDKEYRIRAVSRDPSSGKSKELVKQGVEVVKGDIANDEELNGALNDADYVFLVLNTWVLGPEKEAELTKKAFNAIKKHNVKMLYYSSLPAVSGPSHGKYTKVEHFDVKAELALHAKELGIPVVEVIAAAFYENVFVSLPKKGPDGTYIFTFPVDPTHKMAVFNCARDYGVFLRAAIEANLPSGSKIAAYTEEITFNDYAKQWSEATGRPAKFVQAPREQFIQWTSEDLTEMFEWISEFGYYGNFPHLEESHKIIKEPLQTWKQFCEETDWSKILKE